MISRRSLIATGAGAVALAGAIVVGDATHKLDDVARTIGLKPRAQAVPGDDTLIAAVAKAQNLVLAQIEATVATHPSLDGTLAAFTTIGQEHVTAVGGSSIVPTAEPVDGDPARAVEALATTLSRASAARREDANAAVSPDLARVLSSMSAGLAQCSRAIGALV